ncbi:Tetratricopeptide Repeat Protein 21A [Manis pentadactyla]|nr:Tetratricopeptide Repeat Protein 21A [Manis pentadactyla]
MAGIVYYSQEKYFHQLQQAAAVGLEKFSNDPVLQFFKAYGVLREERTQDAISSLERIRSHPDVSLCSTMALIYAHKHCEVIDQEAVQALKSSLKEMHQTPSGTALYYASLFLWLTGQHGKAKEYISCTLKASSSSREVPAPGRHLSAGLPQEPALCAPEAWPDVPWDGLPEAEASGMMAQEASGRAPKRRRGAWWRCGSAKGSVPA